MDISAIEAQIKAAGVKFLRIREINDEHWRVDVRLDYRKTGQIEASKQLLAASEAGKLDIDPFSIAFSWS
jgi:hypothetical protein